MELLAGDGDGEHAPALMKELGEVVCAVSSRCFASSLMKELGEVVCAVSSRCFASSGVSQVKQSFCAGTTEKLVAPKCCARAMLNHGAPFFISRRMLLLLSRYELQIGGVAWGPRCPRGTHSVFRLQLPLHLFLAPCAALDFLGTTSRLRGLSLVLCTCTSRLLLTLLLALACTLHSHVCVGCGV